MPALSVGCPGLGVGEEILRPDYPPLGLAGGASRRWREGDVQGLGLLPSRSRSGIKPLDSLAVYSVRSLDGGLGPCRGVAIQFFFSKEKRGFFGSETVGKTLFWLPWRKGAAPRASVVC